MKSYAESVGAEVIDWAAVLKDLIENFNQQVFDRYNEKQRFGTCPCGQLSNLIERDRNDAPEDPVLYSLGERFTTAFRTKDFQSAENIRYLIVLRGEYALKVSVKNKREKLEKEIEEKEKELSELRGQLAELK